jgi:hypothetical protein
LRICLECGGSFESSRYRATCSQPCARERRRRQYREAAANRSADSRRLDKVRKSQPEERAKRADQEKRRRLQKLATPRTPYTDLTEDERRAIREYQRVWWRKSPAAEKVREKRRQNMTRLRADPGTGDKIRMQSKLRQRERRRRRALLDTQRIGHESD